MMKKQNCAIWIQTLFHFIHVKLVIFIKDIAEDDETRFDASNYELNRPLSKGKSSNWINERQIRRKNLDKICWINSYLNSWTYSYLIDDGSEDKKAKRARKFVINRKLKFENYENFFEANQLDNKINYQRKQFIDSIETYAYGKTYHPYEEKYQFLIDKVESTGLKHLNDSKT